MAVLVKKTDSIILLFILAAAIGVLTVASPVLAALLALFVLGICVSVAAISYPYLTVVFLVAFMPFEPFLPKFLPTGRLYFASQFVSEFLIYGSLIALLIRRVLTGKPIRRTPVDVPLLVFLGVALLSIVLNRAPIFESLLNLRSLFRYVALFYFVINLDLSRAQINRLVRVILLIGLLQIGIGSLQLISDGGINQYLLPVQTDIEIAGQSRSFVLVSRGREIGSIFGTLGDTLYFGLFMLIVTAIYIGKAGKFGLTNIIILMGLFVIVSFSYARAAVFGMLLLFALLYRWRYGLRRSLALLLLTVVTGVVLVTIVVATSPARPDEQYENPVYTQQSIVDNITGVFSMSYVKRAQRQRLGALLEIAPTIMMNRPLLGFGPAEQYTISRINNATPSWLSSALDDRRAKGFEDVYWVALFAYYGLLGIVVLSYLFYRLYAYTRTIFRHSSNRLTRQLALSELCLIPLTVFLLFFYRVLEFRIYSFYFWLLPALLFSLYYSERASNKHYI